MVQKCKIWWLDPHFGEIKGQNEMLRTQLPITSSVINLQLSVRILSEICSVCLKIVISCPAYYFNPQRQWMFPHASHHVHDEAYVTHPWKQGVALKRDQSHQLEQADYRGTDSAGTD